MIGSDTFLSGLLLGMAVGGGMCGVLSWVYIFCARTRRELEHKAHIVELSTRLELSERERHEARQLFETAKDQLAATFSELSLSALQQNNELFLSVAEQSLSAKLQQSEGELGKHREAVSNIGIQIREALDKVDRKIQSAEKERSQGHGDLTRHLKVLVESAERLGRETTKLSTALRSSKVQGGWGEAQLRNIVEYLGLLPHCDFVEQSVTKEKLRPDLIISLPYGRRLVIDAKAPMNALLDEEAPNGKVIAETVKGHIKALSGRSYPESIEGALEFTMMFLPSEALCSIALEYDPNLYHFAMERKVLLVTPLSLVGFLTLVSSSWQSVRVDENAREMIALGKELYQRVDGFLDHFGKLGRSLTSAVKDYNISVGSFENRLSPSLRRFHELAGESHHDAPAVPAPIFEVVRDTTN